jgi:hypothetical protein
MPGHGSSTPFASSCTRAHFSRTVTSCLGSSEPAPVESSPQPTAVQCISHARDVCRDHVEVQASLPCLTHFALTSLSRTAPTVRDQASSNRFLQASPISFAWSAGTSATMRLGRQPATAWQGAGGVTPSEAVTPCSASQASALGWNRKDGLRTEAGPRVSRMGSSVCHASSAAVVEMTQRSSSVVASANAASGGVTCNTRKVGEGDAAARAVSKDRRCHTDRFGKRGSAGICDAMGPGPPAAQASLSGKYRHIHKSVRRASRSKRVAQSASNSPTTLRAASRSMGSTVWCSFAIGCVTSGCAAQSTCARAADVPDGNGTRSADDATQSARGPTSTVTSAVPSRAER